MKKKGLKILLIIPAYNEEENILKTVNTIKSNESNYDYIVINDGSKDQTQQICEENNLNHINLIHNLGIGGAVQTGYKYAYENNYDIAIQFDGDGQHDINYVKNIIEPILNNKADLVVGSRFIEQVSEFRSTFARRIGINIISLTIKIFTGKKIYDTTSGFRAGNRKVIAMFNKYYPVEYAEPVSSVILLKHGLKISEVPVMMKERTAGISAFGNRGFSLKTLYFMVNVILSIFVISLRRIK